MKIELIEEEKIGQLTWYEIRVDDQLVSGSYNKLHAQVKYEEVRQELLKKKSVASTNILKSEEIENV